MQRSTEVKIGALVLVALALFIAVVFFLHPTGWFKRGMRFTIVVENAHGLRAGSEVYVQGVKVGVVKGISFRRDGKVAVRVLVQEDVPIYSNSRFAIRIHPLLGQAYVSIEAPEVARGLKRLSSGATVRGIEPVELEEVLPRAKTLVERLDRVATSLESLINDRTLQRSIRSVFNDLSAVASELRELVADKKLATSMARAVTHIESVAEQLDQLTSDKGLRGALTMTLSNTAVATDSLKRLLSDKRLSEGLPKLVANLERASSELHSLLSDKELRGSLVKAVNNIEKASQQLNELLSDKDLIEDLRMALSNLNEASGALSQLLSDKELKARVSDTLAKAEKLFEAGSKGVGEFEKAISELRQLIAENRENIKRITAKLTELSEHLEETAKTVNWLLTEGGVGQNVAEAVASLRKSAENVRELTANLKEISSDEEFKKGVKQAMMKVAEASESIQNLAKRSEQLVTDIQRPVSEFIRLRFQPSISIWHAGERGIGDAEVVIASPYRRTFGLIGVHDFTGKGYVNAQFGQWVSDSLALRLGAYRSELGAGVDWRFRGGTLSLNAYDASRPNYNAWLRLRLLDHLHLRIGVEDIRGGGKFGGGIEWRFGE
jgi:phospholipid/cholesterol/gamma-HCH transport system substrate-binding protein